MSGLQLHNVVKTYASFAVRVPELRIEQGELFALLGPSGCGKTTLLKLIAGLLTPDQGSIYWGEREMTQVSPEKRRFSMVFQQPLLFPHMNALDNISFGLRMQKVPRHECTERAIQMLSAVGLSGLGHRLPTELSGGQQQRVSLARALITNPDLLLMDEPFSALDRNLRQEMRTLTLRLQREVTILFVTHDQEEAYLLADRIIVMKAGEIQQVGKPQQLYEQPASWDVANFLGARNVITGEINAGVFQAADLHLPLPHHRNGKGWIVLRPEIIRFHPFVRSHSLCGTIREVTYRLGFYHLHVQVGTHQLELMQPHDGTWTPTVGESISLHFSLDHVHWIPEEKNQPMKEY